MHLTYGMHAMHIIARNYAPMRHPHRTRSDPAGRPTAPPAPMHTYISSARKHTTMSNKTNPRTSLRVNTNTRNALMALRYRWGCPSTDACILRLIEICEECDRV